jgi:hypothetical protein
LGFSNHLETVGFNEMKNNVIPVRRGSQAELAKLYLHLLNAALSEEAASTAPHARADHLSIRNQELSSRRHRQPSKFSRLSARA